MKLSQNNKTDALGFSAKHFALRAVLHARVPNDPELLLPFLCPRALS